MICEMCCRCTISILTKFSLCFALCNFILRAAN